MITRETERAEYSDLQHKHVEDYDVLANVIAGYKARNYRVVATIGTWDLLHIGHVRYLREARSRGDLLVVGVDTDRIIKQLKGELRPVVPYQERTEMLAYQSCVDMITPVDDVDGDGNWQYGLLSKIRPDVFVAEGTSYSDSQVEAIQKYCGNLVVLPRQAQGTSTSQMIQETVKRHLDEMYRIATRR